MLLRVQNSNYPNYCLLARRFSLVQFQFQSVVRLAGRSAKGATISEYVGTAPLYRVQL